MVRNLSNRIMADTKLGKVYHNHLDIEKEAEVVG